VSTCANKNDALSRELRALFAKAKMPTNPALASEILQLTSNAKSSADDFAELIRTDPALATLLLKTANSVQFAQRTPVTTIERAVTVLGLNRVKTSALSFQLVSHMDRLGGVPIDMKAFWQHSVLRACLAHAIAQEVIPQRQEEAFLVGLLQDCGVLLLIQMLGVSYSKLFSSGLSPAAFYAQERKLFPYTHVDAISVMATEWKLPEIIAQPLARHHRMSKEKGSESAQLGAIACFVGGLCFTSDVAAVPEDEAFRQFGLEALRLDEGAWTLAQRRTAEEYQRVNILFGSMLPKEIDIGDLLSEANRQLATAVGDSEERVHVVEAERSVIQQEQRRLQGALREYRERAAMDPLTNVLNRGGLMEAVRKGIEGNLDGGISIGVLFLDLDNFKQLNDSFGHVAGDRTLKALASLLETEIAQRGSVGRYGGEEFVVLMCGLTAENVKKTAEQIVEDVRKLDPRTLGSSGKITCSVGAVWSDRLPVRSAEELLAAADRLMYQAKRSGKDRFCFEVLQSSNAETSNDRATVRRTPATGTTPKSCGDGTTAGSVQSDMLTLARELNEIDVDGFLGIRKQERRRLVAPCVLHYFAVPGPDLRAEPAVTRNLSSGGISLLVCRPMVRGEPVEIMLDKETSKLFLSGLVTYCRHIEGKIHEIGVQFVAHSVTPLIAEGATTAKRHDWITEALNAKLTGKLESQLSV